MCTDEPDIADVREPRQQREGHDSEPTLEPLRDRSRAFSERTVCQHRRLRFVSECMIVADRNAELAQLVPNGGAISGPKTIEPSMSAHNRAWHARPPP